MPRPTQQTCRFFRNTDQAFWRAISRSLLLMVLSAASGANYVLAPIEYTAVLAKNTTYKHPDALRYTVYIACLILAMVDAYVHFKMFNHNRYNRHRQTSSDTTIMNNSGDHDRPTTQALLSSSDIQPSDDLEENNITSHDTSPDLEADRSSTLNQWSDFVRPSNPNRDLEAHRHHHKNGHSHHFTPSRKNKLAAGLCTISCSMDTASAPAAMMALIRSTGAIASTPNTAQIIVELALSLLATLLSIWNASSVYNLTVEHLQNPDSNVHEHGAQCCHS